MKRTKGLNGNQESVISELLSEDRLIKGLALHREKELGWNKFGAVEF